MEQYRDGNIGFSAHTKLPTKGFRKLKSIPKTGESEKYVSPDGRLEECRKFLSHMMHISPLFAVAKTNGNDFESGRVTITPYDLYEAFRLISRVPKDSLAFKTYTKYLGELYEEREKLFPTGDNLLPKYILFSDIPNPHTDRAKYDTFFKDLNNSLQQTLEIGKTENNRKEIDSHDEI